MDETTLEEKLMRFKPFSFVVGFFKKIILPGF